MLMKKDIKKLYNQLIHQEIAQIALDGNEITIRVFEDASKLSFSTPVYLGGNFIPKSVRLCVNKHIHTPFKSSLMDMLSLTIDENNFQVDLHYVGQLENLNDIRFVDLLEEFSFAADEWRLFLDEHDKNDLVHVRVK